MAGAEHTHPFRDDRAGRAGAVAEVGGIVFCGCRGSEEIRPFGARITRPVAWLLLWPRARVFSPRHRAAATARLPNEGSRMDAPFTDGPISIMRTDPMEAGFIIDVSNRKKKRAAANRT